ncbi:hypothetical protein [Streptomyces sp. CL12-4]|jgi:hypothetical protein|uniref:hypothetical protein n=1 Tax=Streptomyces sp. CL12-4 TaxID=2810306 RepID=UPI001EFAC453|nr:hypothetical protein [Streptomyces sp. CL12-4]MCG8970347.1 hypothetical protein [Streptomyces sp. CL12-4]
MDLPRVIDLRDGLALGEHAPEACVVRSADREGVAVADHLTVNGPRVLLVGPRSSLAPALGRRAKSWRCIR